MRYSQLLLKTNKEAREYDSVNATLLHKASFIDQTMAGVYTYLPLGWRVLNKIENIIREEMDTVGAEMLMPAIVPQVLWQKTGRLDTVDILMRTQPANTGSRNKNDASYVLSPTHEEVITPIAAKLKPSYKDLPFAVYQIQTKFRNEERPKSGLLRCREFRMKDLYSFHVTMEDLKEYYERVKDVYLIIYQRLGVGDDTHVVEAFGGDFTKGANHEFQVECEAGEDVICIDKQTGYAYNEEVLPKSVAKERCEVRTVSEVGHIFALGTRFAEDFGYFYTDDSGQRQAVHMASYGLGSSRMMGVLVEKFHDERGIIWPASVAPFAVHLVGLNFDDEAVGRHGEVVYQQLLERGIEVLYDDRLDASPGEKLADADLIGNPWRAVVSIKTGKNIEVRRRGGEEVRIVDLEDWFKEL